MPALHPLSGLLGLATHERRVRAFLALPSGIALLLYSRAVTNGFALDDKVDLLENRFVTGPLDLAGIFTKEYYGGWGHLASGHYRPLLNLTYKLLALPFGVTPLPYHLFNILAFALVVGLSVAVVRKLSGDSLLAVLSGMIFAVHPIASESVAAIVGLKELAAMGLGLLCLWLYILWRESDSFASRPSRWEPAVGVFCALLAAMFYKETALAFLPIVLAAEFLHERSPRPADRGELARRALLSWPLAAAVLAALTLRAAVTGGLFQPSAVFAIDNPLAALPAPQRLIPAGSLLARYLAIYLWPWCLSCDYSEGSFPVSISPADPLFLASSACLVLLVSALAWSKSRGLTMFAFGLIAFASSYALISNLFILLGTIFAERLFFVPSWALATLLAAVVAWVGRQIAAFPQGRGLRAVAAMLLVALLGALATRSWARIPDWRDDRTLIAAALRCYPHNTKALVSLAEQESTRPDHARSLYEEALRLSHDSSFVEAHAGIFLLSHGNEKRGESLLLASSGSETPMPFGMLALALHYAKTGRMDEAFQTAGKLLESYPRYSDAASARAIRGEILLKRGDTRGAEEEYRFALSENPQDPLAHYNLGLCLETLGDRLGALAEYVRSEELQPRQPLTLQARALMETSLGRVEDAVETATRLRYMAPDFLPGREVYASLLYRVGRVDEAMEEAKSILKTAPNSSSAHMVLGSAAEKTGDRDEARRHFEAVLAIPNIRKEMADDLRRRLGNLGG